MTPVSGAVTTCFNDLNLSRPWTGYEANAVLLRQRGPPLNEKFSRGTACIFKLYWLNGYCIYGGKLLPSLVR